MEGSIVMTLQKMLIYMPEAHSHGRPQGCTDTKSPQYVYLAGSEEFDEVLVTLHRTPMLVYKGLPWSRCLLMLSSIRRSNPLPSSGAKALIYLSLNSDFIISSSYVRKFITSFFRSSRSLRQSPATRTNQIDPIPH